ncbi:MAG: endonuclease/exonuclease/phosphatase family protein [Rhizobacter sp.]|nr:endonuclease/exonuclease/phosphatase family protein [Rhizobacter sp.]
MKLVTWNVQWCRGCDGRVDPQRIVDDARALADFDVLCLQEVAANFATLEGSSGEDQFAVIAAALPGFVAIEGIAIDADAAAGGRRRFGNFILSRLPVRWALRKLLPWPADPTVRNMPRVALEVLLEAPFGALRVTTTHLEYYSAMQRAAQLEALRDRHAEACAHALAGGVGSAADGAFDRQPQTVSAIVTGDLNLRPEDPLHDRLGAAFGDARVPRLEDVWQALHPNEPQPPTLGVHDCDEFPEPFACDFILATSDLRHRLRKVAVDAASEASDHQPMLVELG